MDNSTTYYMIKMDNQCKVFSSDILNEDKDIRLFLKDKKYELVPVEDMANIRKSRIYF